MAGTCAHRGLGLDDVAHPSLSRTGAVGHTGSRDRPVLVPDASSAAGSSDAL
ncbi:hypothetical protein HMPREF0058_2059 [Actinomyces urogenitalis DSM 15434]|uniref:Uncharacterized protein n=1 Tax=Actinomyces urogenitalis DSM 15434 TaxID=525246 RepID=C0W865_9ACTO|nr:hypothetical protein HMPREF0058_2059 [Actinomyces urogenitalis DSM 15434]